MIFSGYKVVFPIRKHRGTQYISSFMRDKCQRNATVIYCPNEWVYPNKRNYGPLCVFTTIEEAKNYIYADDFSLQIFKCFYRKSKKKNLFYYNDLGVLKVSLVDFPIGTVLASSVMITEKINKGRMK